MSAELSKLRIGTGFDVHALKEGVPLWLGGLQIDHPRGLAGHSDGDALIHAIVDAVLGALQMGDIGRHFSSDDPRWKGAKSIQFLEWTRDQLNGAKLLHVDSVIMAQEPRLSPYIEKMATLLSETLGAPVSVKATTTDHLGFLGRKEGIAAQASCLVLLP